MEDGEISSEIIFLWWLMRESSCFYDLFSSLEIDKITQRLNEIHLNSKVAKELFNLKLQRKIEHIYAKYLKKKHEIFTTALGTGFLFVVPFFERKESVFIDVDQWFSDTDKNVVTKLPENHPDGAVALLEYTYNDRKVGEVYIISAKQEAIDETAQAPNGLALF